MMLEATDMADDLLRVRLKAITYEAERINAYHLHPLDGGVLPPFTAGSHVDLHFADKMIRSYSLLNDQDERHRYVVAVNLDQAGRGGSKFIHEHFRVGDILAIRPPSNNFELAESAEHSVLIAGGIGITPILSMILRLQKLRRPWELHYAARTRASAAFLDRLEPLRERDGARINVNFDEEPGGRMIDLAKIVAQAPVGADFYCCGPASMLTAFEAATISCLPGRTHVEYFSAKEAPAVSGGFEVILQRSGKSLFVPAGKTILDTLLDAGVNVAYACSEGVCGTCETKVLQGEPDHRDVVLSEDERAANKSMMICCSGSKSPRLVLDI
jgi:tetrachlorobenzoquinone reductase